MLPSLVFLRLLSLSSAAIKSNASLDISQARQEQIRDKLRTFATLGRTGTLMTYLEDVPGALDLLDCRRNYECPVLVTLLWGHYELAGKLMEKMAWSLEPGEDFFEMLELGEGYDSVPLELIRKGKYEALDYLLSQFDPDVLCNIQFRASWGSSTLLGFAKVYHSTKMERVLREYGCSDEMVVSAASQTSSSSTEYSSGMTSTSTSSEGNCSSTSSVSSHSSGRSNMSDSRDPSLRKKYKLTTGLFKTKKKWKNREVKPHQ